jgi:hypothetical protein
MFQEYRRREGLTDVSTLLRFDKNQPRIPSKAELDSTPEPVTEAGQKAKEQAQARGGSTGLPAGGPGGKPDPTQVTPANLAAAPGKVVSAAGKMVPDAVKKAQVPSWLLPVPPGSTVGDVSRGMVDGLNPLPVDTSEGATEGDQAAAMAMGMIPLPGLKQLGSAFRRGSKGLANATESAARVAGKNLPTPPVSRARPQGVLEQDFDDVLAGNPAPAAPAAPVAPPKEDYGPLLGLDSPMGNPSDYARPSGSPPAPQKGLIGRATDKLLGEVPQGYYDPNAQRWVDQRGVLPKIERFTSIPSRVAGLGTAAVAGAGAVAGIPTALNYLAQKRDMDARDRPPDPTTPEGKAAQEEFRKRQEGERMEGPNGREAVGERNQKRVQDGGGLAPENKELDRILQRFEDQSIKEVGANYNKAWMDRVKGKIRDKMPLTAREQQDLNNIMRFAGEGK